MSLDEIRKRQEELRKKQVQEEEEKRRKKEDAKRRQKEREKKNRDDRSSGAIQPHFSQELRGNIGSVSISFSQDLLNSLLEKIWYLDAFSNEKLDETLIKQILSHPKEFDVAIDKQTMLGRFRDNVFFVTNEGTRIPYDEFKQRWMDFWPDLTIEYTPKRKEFVQLLTNRYKNRWVDGEGHHLSEEVFQMLYRLEREPKAMERFLQFTQTNFFQLIDPAILAAFVNRIRIVIAKAIKDDLLNLLDTKRKNNTPKSIHPSTHPEKENSSDDEDDDEIDPEEDIE